VAPQKLRVSEAVARVKDYFEHGDIDLIPFTARTAETYSNIRAENAVQPADAIHLASAAEAQSNLFLTNDRKLHRIRIPGIQFIAGLDGVLF
jgi:predicted nucleic acid-binding protein